MLGYVKAAKPANSSRSLDTSSRHQNSPKRDFKVGRSGKAVVSIIASDLHVEGPLRTTGVIRVEGTVAGIIRADHQVLVAKGGTVRGDIHANEVILDGEVNGSITADARVEVQAGAVICGNIKTPCLIVAEGATVSGPVLMTKPNGNGGSGKVARNSD